MSDLEQGLCLQLLPHPSKKVNLCWLLARLVLEKDKMRWRGSIAYGWRIPIVALRDEKAVPTALWSLPGSNAETGLLEGLWRELLIAEDEGRPVGVLQVIDPAEEESHYWGDVAPKLRAIDIWIGEESDLGRGP